MHEYATGGLGRANTLVGRNPANEEIRRRQQCPDDDEYPLDDPHSLQLPQLSAIFVENVVCLDHVLLE